VIAPSDVERAATEQMAKISTEGCEESAAKLKADAMLSTLTSEPTPVPTFVMRKNEAERSRIQAEIDALL
jgi:Iap family predicted aminopeptidase